MAVHFHRDAVRCDQLTHTLNMTLKNTLYIGAEGAEEILLPSARHLEEGRGTTTLELLR